MKTGASQGAYAIEVEKLSVRYGDLLVLDNINLHIREREIATIVGPNGAGKSTLLKAILGLIPEGKGRVRIFNHEPKNLYAKGLIGYLPQVSSYEARFPLSAFDVVAQARYAKKRIWENLNKNDRELIQKSFQVVEMESFQQSHFGSLSGGQKQRILIARALAMEPRLLILDEPSTGLDIVAQENFYHILRQIRDQKGITILMVSHDIGAVSTIVDTIACLQTKLHFHGKPEECEPDDTLNKIFGYHIHLVRHDEHCETCQEIK